MYGPFRRTLVFVGPPFYVGLGGYNGSCRADSRGEQVTGRSFHFTSGAVLT